MGGLKRPSPEAEKHASKSRKRPLLSTTRPHQAAEITDSEDETNDSEEDAYQTEEEPDLEALALLDELDRKLTSDQPKRFSRNDALAIARHALPLSLYRVAGSSNSRGLNTMDIIDPLHGTDQEYHLDITLAPKDLMRHMVKYHCMWKYRQPSEFHSWTPSLLWVLVHATRKYHEGERDILIYVMDTRKLSPSRIHKCTDLLEKYDLTWYKNGQLYANAVGEYLVHGRLQNMNGIWHAVKFQDLLDAGLAQMMPELSYRLDILHVRILHLRTKYSKDKTGVAPHSLPDWVIDGLRKLARCFGPELEGLIMVTLIAFRERDLNPEVLKTWMPHAFEGMKLPQLPWNTDAALRSFHLSVSGCRMWRPDRDDADENEDGAGIFTILW